MITKEYVDSIVEDKHLTNDKKQELLIDSYYELMKDYPRVIENYDLGRYIQEVLERLPL